jgi:hypothetical protein
MARKPQTNPRKISLSETEGKRNLALPVHKRHRLAGRRLRGSTQRCCELDSDGDNTGADHQFVATYRTLSVDSHVLLASVIQQATQVGSAVRIGALPMS